MTISKSQSFPTIGIEYRKLFILEWGSHLLQLISSVTPMYTKGDSKFPFITLTLQKLKAGSKKYK